jgi:hypothetical protein
MAPQNSLAKIAWKKLEEKMYGIPLYRPILSKRERDYQGVIVA